MFSWKNIWDNYFSTILVNPFYLEQYFLIVLYYAYPSPGWTTIALGFSRFSQIRTFLWWPSRSETSILEVPESVQKRLLCIQSTATPPGREYKYLSWMYGVDRKICHEGH